MKAHSRKANPIELGEITSASVSDDGLVVLVFSESEKGKAGISFDKNESFLIISGIAEYIGKKLFDE